MFRELVLVCILVQILNINRVESVDTFIPGRLAASAQHLCNNLRNRITCPKGSCSGNQRKCSSNSDCSCFPTRMEVCCMISDGSGCCLHTPLPIAIG
ncbi:hypothetical protein JTE90_023479 [Oedothorax gibbosus]|uniref:Uncharacterized protein n=1 Tax=Oedothorax gibbosus TaxID=931172 RepID=A0AAV6VQ37_9ARAC|nr:hypothetical protein JTE90_023479 [Oedothorax gibbosus]